MPNGTRRHRLALTISVTIAGLLVVAGSRVGAAHPASATVPGTAALTNDELELNVEQDEVRYLVRIDMLLESGATNADAEAAKAELIARFPGAVPIEHSSGEVTSQFVASGYTWPAKSAEWSYNPAGKKASLTGDEAAIQAAAATWADQGADFRFTGGGPTTAGTDACNNRHDGHNTVGWADQPGKVLAVTCSWWTSNGVASEFDMQLDPDWPWTTGTAPSTDLQSVTVHEFGHALGLNHSADGGAVMFASYAGGTLKRTPNTDDRAGIVSLYGPSPAGAQTATAIAGQPGLPSPARPARPAPTVLSVRRGANLMTWPGGDTALAGALGAGAAASVQMVYAWDAVANEWRRYSPGAPAFVNDLTMLRRDHAYWVIATSETQLLVGD